MFPVIALPKLFSAPVAAPAILFIVIPPVVTVPVHVGEVLFWSVKVIEAVAIFRPRFPEVQVDGELQGDAALIESVARSKAPRSSVAGNANVLIFPDLNSANIAYKLVQRITGCRALGPILQGLRRPYNDLSRGSSSEEIFDVSCITALMGKSDGSE